MDFEVIIVGTDINAYYMARNTYEKYHKKAHLIGKVPMNFTNYSNILEKALGDKLEMSKDFEIFFERNGQLRSEKHLSSGFKSI